MKAVLMNSPGEPEVLSLGERGLPIVREDHQIRVHLRAAGVNPIDTKLRRRGTFFPEQLPAILGCDGAGVVEQVGAAVEKFRPGDEVYFCQGGLGGEAGNYAEAIVVDERYAAPKPKSLSFLEAAAAPLVLITAWEALYDRGRLAPGQRVLVHGGGGGVGHLAIQLAKLQGAQVCATVGSTASSQLASSLGADYLIPYRETDFVTAVLDWTGGEGVDVALDTVGGDTLTKTFPAVRYGGDIVTILEPAPNTRWKTARDRNLRLGLELMLTPQLLNLTSALVHQGQILARAADLFDRGQLRIHLGRVFPLAAAAAAHRLLEAGSMTGKLVLEIP